MSDEKFSSPPPSLPMPSTSSGNSTPCAVLRHAVTRAEQRRRLAARHVDAGIGEPRELGQDLLDRRVPRKIAPRDAHELPAPENAQRRHERRIVVPTRLRDVVRRLRIPRGIGVLEQTALRREPLEQPFVAQAGIRGERAAGPDVFEARCDRGGSRCVRQPRTGCESLELVDDAGPDRVRHQERARHAGSLMRRLQPYWRTMRGT